MQNKEQLIVECDQVSKCGSHKLRLILVEHDNGGGDFHSVQWLERIDSEWIARSVYTQKTFSRSLGKDAWVSDIHAFDPIRGIATLRFGTRGPSFDDGSEFVLYSWREWNLLEDCEYRFIEICEDIFGPPVDKFRADCAKEIVKANNRESN